MAREKSGRSYAEKVADEQAAIVSKIAEKIKQGQAPWQKPWVPGVSRRPLNPTTGKPYRGFNSIWLMAQDRNDPRWMTYNQAEANGAQVRKGEKGTTIEYWQWTKDVPVKDDNGKPVKDADGKQIYETERLAQPRVFLAKVFNAEQIDGLPPLERLPVLPEWERHMRAEAIIAASPAPIRHIEGNGAYYEPVADRITMPLRSQFPTGDAYYATVLHEIGHSTGHVSRLDRDLSNPFGSKAYAREELVAEFTSLFVGEKLDIGHDPDRHASYIGNWLQVIAEDPRALWRAAAEAEKAAEMVLGYERDLGLEAESVKVLGIEADAPLKGKATIAELIEFHEVAASMGVGEGERNAMWRLASQIEEGGAVATASRMELSALTLESDAHSLLASYLGRDAITDETELKNTMQLWEAAAKEVRINGATRALSRSDRNLLTGNDRQEISAIGQELGVSKADMAEAGKLMNRLAHQVADVLDNSISPLAASRIDASLDALRTFSEQGRGHLAVASELVARIVPADHDGLKRPAWMMAPDELTTTVNAVLQATQAREQSERLTGGELEAVKGEDEMPKRSISEMAAAKRPANDRGGERVNLHVPFAEKNEAKALGARWDAKAKTWYAPAGADLTNFERWTVAPAKEVEVPVQVQFAEALTRMKFDLSNHTVQMDGKWHRVRLEGDHASKLSGAYRAFDREADPNGWPAGVIENHRDGIKITWKADQAVERVPQALIEERNKEAAAKRAERDAAREAEYIAVGKAAEALIEQGQPTGFHNPYLLKKDIEPTGVRTQVAAAMFPPGADAADQQTLGGAGHLLVPGVDMDGRVWTVQTIGPNGAKAFAKGGRVAGTHHFIGQDDGKSPLLIAEGYATGADLNQQTGLPVAVAFNANNLAVVAMQFREKYPDRQIIIAGDNDHKREREIDAVTGKPKSNVGKEKAELAAEAVGGKAIVPPFGAKDKGSDWNDYRKIYGGEAVVSHVRTAVAALQRDGRMTERGKERERANAEKARPVEKKAEVALAR